MPAARVWFGFYYPSQAMANQLVILFRSTASLLNRSKPALNCSSHMHRPTWERIWTRTPRVYAERANQSSELRLQKNCKIRPPFRILLAYIVQYWYVAAVLHADGDASRMYVFFVRFLHVLSCCSCSSICLYSVCALVRAAGLFKHKGCSEGSPRTRTDPQR